MNNTQTPPGESLVRLPAVCAKLGLGRSSVYDLVKRGELCPPVKLGMRVSAWPLSALDAFIAERILASRELRK